MATSATAPTSLSEPKAYRVIRQIHVCGNDIGNLYNNDVFSDLVLVAPNKRYKVHKNILAIRSGYFRSLLYGANQSDKIELPINESKTELFEKLLRYVYLGEMHIPEPFVADATEMLYMASKYSVPDLKKSLVDELKTALSPTNFCTIYSAAFSCSASSLIKKCLEFANEKPIDILRADGFTKMDIHAVDWIINRDSLKPHQIEVFKAVTKWIEANGKLHTEILLSQIQLEEMPEGFLENTVRSSGLFSDSRILDAVFAIRKKNGAASIRNDEAAKEIRKDVKFEVHHNTDEPMWLLLAKILLCVLAIYILFRLDIYLADWR